MSNNEPQEHLHLLSSNEAGWNGLQLIYEREPADEIPENWFTQHLLLIFLEDVQANFMLNGSWQRECYTNGDLTILPTSQLFPRTQIDREFTLIDLYLEPATLAHAAHESVDADRIELVPQWKLRDPLIEQMGLALKVELEAGGADSRLYAESMATALAVHLLRRYSLRKQEIKDYTGGLPKYRLRQAIAYINEHLDQNLTLAELAFVVHMSLHYFASLFKQSTGLSPHQYVTKCRIAMTVTSFERPATWLGQWNWKILHSVGMHFFWLGFTLEFSLRISKSVFIYLPLVILLVLAIIIRLVAPRMQREFAR